MWDTRLTSQSENPYTSYVYKTENRYAAQKLDEEIFPTYLGYSTNLHDSHFSEVLSIAVKEDLALHSQENNWGHSRNDRDNEILNSTLQTFPPLHVLTIHLLAKNISPYLRVVKQNSLNRASPEVGRSTSAI